MTQCNVCGHPIEDRGYKHAQCRFCGQVSNLSRKLSRKVLCTVRAGVCTWTVQAQDA